MDVDVRDAGLEEIDIRVLHPENEEIPNSVKDFIVNHHRSNWFTNQALIPAPPVAGNSHFILFLAFKGGELAGVIVANLFYNICTSRLMAGPFRLQINGAPMIRQDREMDGKILGALLMKLTWFADSHVPVTEFRNFPTAPGEREVFRQAGFIFEPHLNLLKPLTTAEEAWSSLSKSRRRQIRRSFGNGTRLEVATTSEQVIQLYRILFNLYTNKIHKKLPPLRTFLAFLGSGLSVCNGVILVVTHESTVIGGIVCLIEPGRSLIEWYVCGLDHLWRNHFPSVMATWAGIRYACDQGLPCFNFLGLGKPGVPYGVREFKLRFGGNTEDYGRFLRIGAMPFTQTNHNPQITR